MISQLHLEYYILISLLSFILSLSIGFILCSVSLPSQLYDHPNARKIHNKPTLNLGGFVIITSLTITSLLFGLLENEDYRYYLILCTIFFLIGFLDDINNWNYKKKFITQTIAAVLFLTILPLDLSKLVFTSIDLQIPWINYIILTIFIVGIVNAFNFFDGINWLAGSMAIVTLFSYGLLDTHHSSITISIYLILIFSIMGFLYFNRAPAKMFLGDSGSNFLGFIMATSPLIFFDNSVEPINVNVPFIITSILSLETAYLIYSRLKRKKSPFFADKNHLHHILLDLNLRNRYVVFLISVSTILLSITAYYSNNLLFYQVALIEIAFLVVVIILPRIIKNNKKLQKT